MPGRRARSPAAPLYHTPRVETPKVEVALCAAQQQAAETGGMVEVIRHPGDELIARVFPDRRIDLTFEGSKVA